MPDRPWCPHCMPLPADVLRDLRDGTMTLGQAAHALGVAYSTARRAARRAGLTFRVGRPRGRLAGYTRDPAKVARDELIRADVAGGMSYRVAGAKYGLCAQRVLQIVRGRGQP